jgi:hypothetical protein
MLSARSRDFAEIGIAKMQIPKRGEVIISLYSGSWPVSYGIAVWFLRKQKLSNNV